jgi:diaminopimelate decarboxylase
MTTAAPPRTTSAPVLRAKQAPWMQRLLAQPETVRALVESYGSPLHVVVDSEFKRNVGDLLSPLKERKIDGSLYFARKANKLPWFVSAAKEVGIGVDTASLAELQESLALGVAPESLTLTAIAKTKQLVQAAVEAGVMIVIDNYDELELARAVAAASGKVARIGLRFSGFEVQARKVFSRFGFDIAEANALLDAVSAASELRLELLHAHLDRYDTSERAAAARHLLRLASRAEQLGIKLDGIDLGGGILIRYLESQSDFEGFVAALIDSVRGARDSFTWLQDGLGYTYAGGEIQGRADLYPAWNNLSKERFIAAVLDNADGGGPLYREFQQRNLKLYFEPGRALLDNVGMTFASVAFRKRDTLGNLLVGLSMNRTHLRPFRAEFCSDPILLCDGEREPLAEGAFLVGNLCSESDLIYRRKLALFRKPKPGDLFCFINSAGYLAHHMEIGTHGDALPTNVLVGENFEVRQVHRNRG